MSNKKMPASLVGGDAPRTPTVLRKADSRDSTDNERKARGKARLRTISVFKLMPHWLQPESRHSMGNVLDLAGSIRELGRMLEPPLVRRTIDGRYVILAGHRRCYAWRLLVAEGHVPPGIEVYVLEDISDQDEAKFIAAEYLHRQEYTVIHKARIVGHAHGALSARKGGEVTLRELEAVFGPGRTSLGHYLTIYEALQDDRLAPLVHSVDKPSKALLYKALNQEDFPAKLRALEALQPEPKKLAPARCKASSRGRPPGAVKRRKVGKGFELTVRIRVRMTPEEVRHARSALTQAFADIDALHGPEADAPPV